MSLAPPEALGPLRRERLRTARLYFICEALPGGQEPAPLLQAALTGGVDIVQLREKELDKDEIERSGRTFRRLCDTHSALFIVNDDPWLARECGADGVHVGQDDASAKEAREVLGPDAIIGLSTHSPEQLAASASAPVDYVSAGPIWETPTKEGRPAVGLGYVEHAAANAPHPFFAIGGIDASNAAEVVGAGARRLGVVRAIRDSEDPMAAAAALREALAVAGEAAPGA
jgi:thiamine-phosphate pyrophosphorylase